MERYAIMLDIMQRSKVKHPERYAKAVARLQQIVATGEPVATKDVDGTPLHTYTVEEARFLLDAAGEPLTAPSGKGVHNVD